MINLTLIAKLNLLLVRFPASIDSLVRTAAHNQAVGGAPNSAHVQGAAADLLFDDPSLLIPAGQFAITLGFNGVEVDLTNNHLHVDVMPREWHVVKTWHAESPLTASDPAPPKGLL